MTKQNALVGLLVSAWLIVLILLHCYRSTAEGKAVEPATPTPFLVEEPPLNTVDPSDPYKEEMQVLTLEDAEYCPRIYSRIQLRKETFWVDKKGRIFEICKKTGRLVQSL